MANFKGGFAFNNEAAKVEVEQAPDGTLISCVNPVTGEELGGGNSIEVIEGTAADLVGTVEAGWLDDIRDELIAGNISVVVDFDLSTVLQETYVHYIIPLITIQTAINPDTALKKVQFAAFTAVPPGSSAEGLYGELIISDSKVVVMLARIQGSATFIPMESLSLVPTVTKIYHHTMPE